jgi:hypothetical protein
VLENMAPPAGVEPTTYRLGGDALKSPKLLWDNKKSLGPV